MTDPFFVEHASGQFFHGTRADLRPGDLVRPGYRSNFEDGRFARHVYVTKVLDVAVLAAELARGTGRERVYVVAPRGPVHDDPNVTDKKFRGNPTRSFRTREPVLVVGEMTDWVGHSAEFLQEYRAMLDDLKRTGRAIVDD